MFAVDFVADFWRMFGGVLDRFSYSLGVCFGGCLEVFLVFVLIVCLFDSVFIDSIFSIQPCIFIFSFLPPKDYGGDI